MIILLSCVLEALLFPTILAYSYNVKTKKEYILRCFGCMFVAIYLNEKLNNDYIFWLPVLFIFICVHILEERKAVTRLEYSINAMMIYFVIVSMKILLMLVFVSKYRLIKNIDSSLAINIIHVFKSVTLLVITYIYLKKKVSYHLNLNLFKWSGLVYFELILLTLLLYINKCIMNNQNEILYIIAFIVILLNIIFLLVINKIESLQQENIQLITQQKNIEFNNEKLKIIKRIKNEINAIDHRLFYVIFKIDYLLENNEFDKIKIIINKYKEIITKHNMIIDTNNPVFDCLMSLKVSDLMAENVNVKCCIFISENEKYNDLSFINFLTCVLDGMIKNEKIQLFMKEEPGFIVINLLSDDLNGINEETIKTEIIKLNGEYKINREQNSINMIIPH